MQQPWTVPADKYEILQECRAAFLVGLEQAARDGGVADRDAIAALQQGAGGYFDEMVSPTHKPGFEAADGLTASRITLVPESELELEIELGDMARRLHDAHLEHLRRAYLRFVTLLNRPDLPTQENPVGIDSVAEGLTRMFSTLGQNSQRSLSQLELIEASLNRNLPALYDRVVAILDRHQVKPALAKIQTHPGGPAGANVAGNSGGAPAGAASAQPTASTGHASTEPPPVPLQGLTQEMLNRLFARLDMLEAMADEPRQPGQSVGQGVTRVDPAMLLANLAQQLAQAGATPSGAESEGLAKAVDHLARVFTAIFDHPMLPDAIKTAIGSLQSTIIKAAMLDGSFYTSEQHPVRLLLARMIDVSLGLPAHAEDHPTCVAVHEIAGNLRAGFHGDIRVFKHYLAELDVLAAVREEQITETVAVFTPLLEKWDRLENAHALVSPAIEAMLDETVPIEIASFLRYDWARVVQQDVVEQGESSAAWRNDLGVAEQLLQSIRPARSADERKQQVAAIPAMLAAINAGFDRIQLSKAERDAFMDACFKLQTGALRGIAPVVPASSPAPVNSDAPLEFSRSMSTVAEPKLQEVSLDGLTLKVWKTGDPPPEAPAVFAGRDWTSLRWPATGELLCGCLCWQNPVSGHCLICNPGWNFAVVIAASELERLLTSRQARLASACAVF